MKRATAWTGLISLLALFLASSPVMAENHFILEMNGGGASDIGVDAEVEAGPAYGATFGFGGTVPGQSPAYYAIARIGASAFNYSGAGSQPPQVEHAQQEWAIGGRVYLPLTQRFRIMAQAAVGQTLDEATINNKDGTLSLVIDSSTWAIFTQAGMQFRVTDGFALGLAADLALYPDSEERQLAARQASIGTAGQLGVPRLA